MLKRFSAGACALVITLWMVVPVFASTKVVASKSTRATNGSLYFSHGLSPGHDYRLDFVGPGHKRFRGYATIFYSGVSNHRLYTQTHPLLLSGMTPDSVKLLHPTSPGVGQWTVTLNVRVTGTGMTVRLVDLGHRRA